MAFFIPIVIAGARFLIPAAAREGLKRLAQSSGATAAQAAAKRIAQSAVQTRRAARQKMKTSDKPKTASEQDLKNVKQGVEDMKKRTVTTPRKATAEDLKNIETGIANLKKGQNRSRAIKGTAAAVGAGTIAHGLMSGSQEDVKTPKSGNTSKTKRQRFDEAFAAARKEKGAGKTFMFEGTKYTTDRGDDKPKASEATIPKKPTQAAPKPETSQETEKRSSVKPTEKKRDRLFGLDFLPEIDSKEGGDKVNLPFGLGSYETLPQEEDYSKNKKGGSIKRQSGGTIGCGKAMRGFGKAPYKKKGM